ncbi:MAG: hypothetical protein ACETWM_14950 [Candidatus Lokiarchaeia archaeon]
MGTIIGKKWMALAIIFIVATAGLAIGFGSVFASSQNQQLVPIPVTETEALQTGNTTYTQQLWSFLFTSYTIRISTQPHYENIFLPFYQEGDWFFYIDDSTDSATYEFNISVLDWTGTQSKTILSTIIVQGDLKIVLNETQRSDLVSYGDEFHLKFVISPTPPSDFTLKCNLTWNVPLIENVSHTSWLLYLI